MGLLKKLRLPGIHRKFSQLDSSQVKIGNSILKLGDLEAALNVGDQMPLTSLCNCFGENISLEALLERGPLVLKFFMGTWSSSCSADLMILEDNQQRLRDLNTTLVAVSTQGADRLGEYSNEHGINFHLVSSKELVAAFGLTVKMTEELIAAYKEMHGIKLAKVHGRSLPEISYPATYVIDQSGVIAYAQIAEDILSRPDPEEIIKVINKLNKDHLHYLGIQEEPGSLRKRVSEKLTRVNSGRRGMKTRSVTSLNEAEAKEDPFQFCLRHEEFASSFKAYLAQTGNHQGLQFYQEATHFRDHFQELSEEAKRLVVGRILKVYVMPGSEQEVFLTDSIRGAIITKHQRNLITENLFLHAIREVRRQLEEEAFPKWQRTPEFKRLWGKTGQLQALAPRPS